MDETFTATDELFSTGLVEGSKSQRSFLRTLHRLGVTQVRPSLESVRRYTDLWLPLVAEYQRIIAANENIQQTKSDDADHNLYSNVEAVGLVPPADVAWLWHCHRLAPRPYANYVNKVAEGGDEGAIMLLEADPPFALQHCTHNVNVDDGSDCLVVVPNAARTAATNARIMWQLMYPDEPFFLPPEEAMHPEEYNDGDGMIGGFDILASAERQRTFLWQVSGPRFEDESFLKDGVTNYWKFLRLRASSLGRRQIIVPTYQIDLMW